MQFRPESSSRRVSRAWITLSAITALTLATAACGVGTGASAADAPSSTASVAPIPSLPDSQQVSITFESYNLATAGAASATINGLVADFEAAHPNIHVTAQAPQSGGSAASVQSQAIIGKAPDVAQLTFADLKFAVSNLKAKSLDTLVGRDAVQANFGGTHPYAPTATKLGDVDGDTYGMPYVFSTPVLFINSELFTAAGLDPNTPPTTWAQVKTDALAISKATGKGGAFIDCLTQSATDWCWQSLVKSDGGTVLSSDGTKATFAGAGALGAVEMAQDLVTSGAMPSLTQAQAVDAFNRGNLGMMLETSALQGGFQASAATGGWTLATAQEPSFGATASVPTNSGSALFIFSDDQAKQRAAWELIQFMTSDHAYTQISSKIGYLPLRTTLVDDPATLKPWADAHPLIKPNLDQLSRLQPWSAFPGDSYTQIVTLMMAAVESIVFQGKDAKSTLTDAQTRAQALMPA
jgi:multiple sugar transport system substrate-binding protein